MEFRSSNPKEQGNATFAVICSTHAEDDFAPFSGAVTFKPLFLLGKG